MNPNESPTPMAPIEKALQKILMAVEYYFAQSVPASLKEVIRRDLETLEVETVAALQHDTQEREIKAAEEAWGIDEYDEEREGDYSGRMDEDKEHSHEAWMQQNELDELNPREYE